jgi:hypothetical protein
MSSAKPAWWLTVDGQSYGPYDLRTMQGYIAEGRVTGESVVCRVGDQTWSPARGDSLLFRGSAAAPPPFAGGAAPPGAAPQPQTYAQQEYTPPGDAGAAPAAIGNTKKIVLAVLGAALVGLFFAPWVNVMIVQLSGYDIVRSYQMLYGGGMPSMPGMPGMPGRMQGPGLQVDMGWRAYQPFLLYLIPLAGIAVFATALAGLRLWRVAAIACGVVVWGILALGAVQAGDAGINWSQIQDSLRYLAFGAYGTLAVATVITAIGFTRG